MNKVNLIGRWTREPELRFTSSGSPVVSNTLAVDRRQKNGENAADFIPVTCWGKNAENVSKYTKKGSKVAVSGSIQTKKSTSNTGQYKTSIEVIASEIYFLDPKKTETTEEKKPEEEPLFSELDDISDDDMPF